MWHRWRTRTKEISAIAPDPALQLKGLLKMTKRTLESHRELQFRVSLVRSGLQVDTTPSDTNVEQFAYHLLAEFEQLALTEKRLGDRSDPQKPKPQEAEKPKVLKLKKLEEETKYSPRREDSREEKPKCKFYTWANKVADVEKLAAGRMIKRVSDDDVGTVEALSTWLQLALSERTRWCISSETQDPEGRGGGLIIYKLKNKRRWRANWRPVHEGTVVASQH